MSETTAVESTYFGTIRPYLSLSGIVVGLIGNVISFLVFRSKDFQKNTSLTILSFFVVVNLVLKYSLIFY